MKTNIVISLDTRRPKLDGTFPLVLRLGHHRKTITISLGLSLKREDWDENKRLIKKSYTGAESIARINNYIQKKKAEAMEIIVKLWESGELDTLSINALKNYIIKPNDQSSFYQFTEHLIIDLKKSNRFGTANSYQQTLNSIRSFHKNRDLDLKDISYTFLSKYETDYYSKGNSANGLAVYMRTIRAIINKAIKSGVLDKEYYPFNSYKIKSVPTEKRALDLNYLERIFKLEIKSDSPIFHARNYFIASYMLYGINFKDMALLEKTDIQNGRISYRREKTQKLFDIKISPQLKIILDFYSNNSDSQYIFPIIKRKELPLIEKDIHWARKRYNKKLKMLAEECGIDKNLTSYVSRHSFATQAMLQEVPLYAISSMLGHSSLKTTQVYLKSLPSNILDDYNEKIIGG